MYCGKLQKKTNAGKDVFNWVIYLILTYFPFTEGGGVLVIIGNRISFSFEGDILGPD